MYYSRLNNGKDVNILWFLKLVLLYAVNKKIIIQESTAFESGIKQDIGGRSEKIISNCIY